MKNKAAKIFLACTIAFGSWFLMAPAEARHYNYYNYYYVQEQNYPVYRVHYRHHDYVCKVYSGFWRHGYWFPPERICWRR